MTFLFLFLQTLPFLSDPPVAMCPSWASLANSKSQPDQNLFSLKL